MLVQYATNENDEGRKKKQLGYATLHS